MFRGGGARFLFGGSDYTSTHSVWSAALKSFIDVVLHGV